MAWRLGPGLPLSDERPEVQSIIQGCALELHLPEGRVIATHLVTYGVPLVEVEGGFTFDGPPMIQFTVPAEVSSDPLPEGTQVWLPSIS